MARFSCLILFLLFHTVSNAGDIQHIHVAADSGRYEMEFRAVVMADYDAVYDILTDYDGLHRLSNTFIESRLLHEWDASHKRSLIVTRTCVLFFCFKANMVEDVEERDNGEIISTMVGSDSDYRYGLNHWKLTRIAPRLTLIQFHCEKEPDFWVPPVIGPWIIKRKMLTESAATIQRIEQLAQDV